MTMKMGKMRMKLKGRLRILLGGRKRKGRRGLRLIVRKMRIRAS
jgi:hypothetical protein